MSDSTNHSDGLHRLLKFVWKKSPFYRDLYFRHGIRENDLVGVTIGDLPFVTKDDICENFDRVVTDPRLKRKEILDWLEDDHNPRHKYLDEFIVVRTSDVVQTY